MSGNLIAIFYTLLLIIGCLALAYLISKKSATIARKIVHIGVAQWFFIYAFCFTNPLPALLGLASFAVINGALNITGGLGVLMGQPEIKRNWGLVWYPISFILMILLCEHQIGSRTALGCAMLGMGWGDGLAAIIGGYFGKRRICGSKTLLGFITLFCVVFIICCLFTKKIPVAIATALVAAILEILTPFGLDNLSVPLGIYAVVTVFTCKADLLNGMLFGWRWELSLLIVSLLLIVLAVSAVKLRLLTVSGGMAAYLVGLSVICGFRFAGLLLLLIFFVSSNLVGKLRSRAKDTAPEIAEAKGGQRDHAQVAANGLFAALAALLWLVFDAPAAVVLFGAAAAEANADTWAGELGRLSARPPVSILSGKPVTKGMSGGVTPLGLAAGLMGALLISVPMVFLFSFERPFWAAAITAVSGFAGCVLDSLLGDRLQALYLDETTGTYSEAPCDSNGKELRLVRGLRRINNDAVNMISNGFSFLLALVLFAVFC